MSADELKQRRAAIKKWQAHLASGAATPDVVKEWERRCQLTQKKGVAKDHVFISLYASRI